MKKIIFILGILFLVLPFVSADVIIEGYHSIDINNRITNINDFPNYTFISGPDEEAEPGLSMCKIKIIKEEGLIEIYYKFCSISVYAIENSKLDYEVLNKLMNPGNYAEYSTINENGRVSDINYSKVEEDYKKFLIDSDAIKILSGITTSKTVSDTNSIEEINNSYIIDANLLVSNNQTTEKNNLIYFYIGIPILALIIILVIILKRK